MSDSPTAQLGQGTGSGRRTIPATRSPFLSKLRGPGSMTRPMDSWPSMRRVIPGGAQPYFPAAISRSVPHTAAATASTRIEPSRSSGSGNSSNRTVPGFPGSTVIAFIVSSPIRFPRPAGLMFSAAEHRVRPLYTWIIGFFSLNPIHQLYGRRAFLHDRSTLPSSCSSPMTTLLLTPPSESVPVWHSFFSVNSIRGTMRT